MRFRGMLPAIPTPFDEQGQPIEAALRAIVRHNIAQGMDGLYVGGSTSEAFLMPDDMRRLVLEIVADEAAGEVPTIAHVGHVSTHETVALARHAEELGFDAISIVPPFYYRFSVDELRGHTRAVGEAVGIPTILYNIPAATGVNIDLQVMREMLAYDFVAGLKHTAQDFFVLERLKDAHPDKAIFVGQDEALVAGLAMGADGGIGSTYSVLGPRITQIYHSVKDNMMADALAHQRAVNAVIECMRDIGVYQALKVLLTHLGLEGGVCRHPFTMPSADEVALLRKTYEQHFASGVLNNAN